MISSESNLIKILTQKSSNDGHENNIAATSSFVAPQPRQDENGFILEKLKKFTTLLSTTEEDGSFKKMPSVCPKPADPARDEKQE